MASSKGPQQRRFFDPEYLAARRDITKAMLAAAQGNVEVARTLVEENESELSACNKDGNTMLLLAGANGHVDLTQTLLELKADVYHKNFLHLDILDYATMDGISCPMAKAVLSHFDFVVPEVIDGPFHGRSNEALASIKKNGISVARSSVLGKTPDFSDILAKETEYRVEWLKSLTCLVDTVKRGYLLPYCDVAYLERDATLSGALEVPQERRYVFRMEDKSIVRYSTALRSMYRERMEQRLLEASMAGDAACVHALLKARALPNSEDARGQTALMRAAHHGDPVVLRCLIQAKARLDARNKDGFSAFFLAAANGHEPAVRMLVRAKADLNLRSYKSNTALDFVRHQGHTKLLKAIEEERQRLREEEKALQARR